ncbi:unnamed protein product [Echinostoma caproni]|uniref:18 kDa Sin3-associated polypeptide n=1 Tax=Echinostoma caproni TaxID=27848 RepID=A0A3P8HB10_9TREM|nr:unnamed protein product [Echinostoma caproni]
MVKQVNPESRRRGTIFDFALVSPDVRSPSYRMRELGAVCSGFPSDTDRIMLKDCQFVIGDMIDVAITPPASEASYPHPAEVGPVDSIRTVRRGSPLGALPYGRGMVRRTGEFGSRNTARYGRPFDGP